MKIPRIKLSEQTKEQFSSAGWGTVGVVLLIYTAQGIAGIFQKEPGVVQAVVHIMVSLTGLRYLLRGFKLSAKECGITRPQLGLVDFGVIILCLVGFCGIIMSFPGRLVWSGLTRSEMLTILSFAAYNGIKSPVVEEFLFRGLLFKVYERYWGKTAAVLLTLVVFTVPHIRGEMGLQERMLSIVGYLAISLLFALLRLYDQHVWGGILLHSVWNVVLGHQFVVKISPEVSKYGFFTYLLDPSQANKLIGMKYHVGLISIAAGAIMLILVAMYVKKRRATQRV